MRKLVSAWRKLALLWLRGTYRGYTDHNRAVVGVIWAR